MGPEMLMKLLGVDAEEMQNFLKQVSGFQSNMVGMRFQLAQILCNQFAVMTDEQKAVAREQYEKVIADAAAGTRTADAAGSSGG